MLTIARAAIEQASPRHLLHRALQEPAIASRLSGRALRVVAVGKAAPFMAAAFAEHEADHFLFGVLAMGEGWHHSHHTFPTSARHGLRWWQIDVSYWVIRALALLGLAWNVKIPSKQAQRERRRRNSSI